MTGGGDIPRANHLLELREERSGRQKNCDDINYSKIKGLVRDLDTTKRRLILHSKSIGVWLNVQGTTVTGTLLSATESCDFLCARYNVTPPLPYRANTTALAHP